MGVVDARMTDLIRRLTTGESSKVLEELEGFLDVLETDARQDEPDAAHMSTTINEMKALLKSRGEEQAVWAEIRDTVETRRRLSETERRLLEAKQATVEVAQLRVVVAFLLHSVREHVLTLNGGRKAVDSVAEDVRKLLLEPA